MTLVSVEYTILCVYSDRGKIYLFPLWNHRANRSRPILETVDHYLMTQTFMVLEGMQQITNCSVGLLGGGVKLEIIDTWISQKILENYQYFNGIFRTEVKPRKCLEVWSFILTKKNKVSIERFVTQELCLKYLFNLFEIFIICFKYLFNLGLSLSSLRNEGQIIDDRP